MLKNIVWASMISLLLAAVTYSQNAADVTGDWQGTLTAGPTKLRLVLRIAKTDAGWNGKFVSIDQSPDWGAEGAPLESVDFQHRNLKFRIAAQMLPTKEH